jgi:hypothetical protein
MKFLFLLPILLLLFFTFSIFYKSDSSFDQDLGRHLKLGEIIVSTHQVPKINLFSYTYPDFPFINHHFLFEVFIYLWSLVLSLQSLLIFKILISLISVGIILATIKKSNYPLLLPLGYIFLHVLRERTELRPEIFSFLFIALTFFILERFYVNLKTKLIYFLPFIQLIWINTHIYFFVGIALQLIYLIDSLIKKDFKRLKTIAIISSISILFMLLNPNYLDGLLYPFRVFNNYGYTIAENQSIFLLENLGFKDSNFLFVKICSFLILFSILISFLRKTWSFKNLLVALMGLIMALSNIRSFPLLFYLSFPIVLQNFDIKKYNKKIYFLIIVSALLLCLESITYLNNYYYNNSDSSDNAVLKLRENVKGGMDFVIKNNLPQPIYNNFDIGSYIIYRGYPNYKVFVDGRPEGYPADFFQKDYIPSQLNSEIFMKLDDKYNFKTIIFSISDQTPWGKTFLKNIIKDKTWSIVYIDNFVLILVKKDFADQIGLNSIDFNTLSPEKYSFHRYHQYLTLSYFLININHLKSAESFVDKALLLNPDSKIANNLKAFCLSKNSDLNGKALIPFYLQKGESNIWW